ncbi:hypothetical protein [uncultured Legionella sp.]|uniref:hypothetical protein n=1 Tax=uncultured Legionella sp. TaxID=210934 RepID=UPI0026207D5E|nr:hypothetical protein [uncultured Legionella sp.]
MTFQEFLKKFNDFLFTQCGMTNTIFDHIRFGKEAPIKSLFFHPYQSKTEFFYKTASVVTAPASLSVIALELATASLWLGIRSAVDLAKFNTHAAKIHLIDGIFHMVFALISALTAVASPFINAIDLVGAGIATLTQKNEVLEEMKPSFD